MLFSDTTNEDQNVEEFIADDTFDFQPKENYDYQELKEFMSNVIDNLSDENRMCIIMFYFQQLSIAEIADVFDVSQNTIKSRLNYGKKQIKRELETSESKGISFRGIAPIPFMLWTLSEFARSSSISIETGTSFFSTILNETPVLVNSIVAAGNTESIKETVVKIAAGLSLLTATTVGGVAVANNYIKPPEVKAEAIFIPTEIEAAEVVPIKKDQITWVKEPEWVFDTAPIALYGKGFLVERNGKHQFIGIDGVVIKEYPYKFRSCPADGAFAYNPEGELHDFNAKEEYLSDSLAVTSVDNRICSAGVGGVSPALAYSPVDGKVYSETNGVDVNGTPYTKESGEFYYDMKIVFFIKVGELADISKNEQNWENAKWILFNGITIINGEEYDEYKKYEVPFDLNRQILGLAGVKQNGKWAVVNANGERVTDFKYDEFTVLNMDYIKYSNDGEVGLLNSVGEVVVKGEYEDITAPSQNTVMIKKNGAWGVASIDNIGE